MLEIFGVVAALLVLFSIGWLVRDYVEENKAANKSWMQIHTEVERHIKGFARSHYGVPSVEESVEALVRRIEGGMRK